MADEKQETTILGGWFKGLITSLLGLITGGILIYLSPLINNAIKPAKPLPNFSYKLDGQKATFSNKSIGGTEGWWDFGDGTALEPFNPNTETFTHEFPSRGSYTVKLSLTNLIGEEADRSVSVNIVSGKIGPPIGGPGNFGKPYVPAAPKYKGTPSAVLQVSYQAYQAERKTKTYQIPVTFNKNPIGNSIPFAVEKISDEPGYYFVDAKLLAPPVTVSVKNPKLEISSDQKSIKLSGELVNSGGILKAKSPPSWTATVQAVLEGRTNPVLKLLDPVEIPLNIPGTTTLTIPSLPAGWMGQDRKMNLDILENSKSIWRDSKLPLGVNVNFQNQAYQVNAAEKNGQITIDVKNQNLGFSNNRPFLKE